jgi:hypothetical protein
VTRVPGRLAPVESVTIPVKEAASWEWRWTDTANAVAKTKVFKKIFFM